MIIFYQQTSGSLLLTGLFLTQWENAAEIFATLQYANGKPVTGFVDVQGQYVPGSNGNYSFAVSDSITAPTGGGYQVMIVCNCPGGYSRTWYLPAQVALSNGGN